MCEYGSDDFCKCRTETKLIIHFYCSDPGVGITEGNPVVLIGFPIKSTFIANLHLKI